MDDRFDRFDKSVNNWLEKVHEPEPTLEEILLDEVPPEVAPSPETPAPKKKPTAKRSSGEPKSLNDMLEDAKEATEKFYYEENEERRKALESPPEAFVEPPDRTYATDDADRLLTIPGFVTDYVNCLRGMEAPTLMGIWGALWTVSSALARDAWIKWFPKPLWPNIYVMIVAPPALCRKSSSMDIGVELLSEFPARLPSSVDEFLKGQHLVSSKSTAEGMLALLKPEERPYFSKSGGKILNAKRTSKVTIAVSELPTFLGKQQYNMGLISLLLDLYDCKDKDREITRGRGPEEYEGIYATMIGAIAPDGLRGSIPTEAFGGGFMSRVVTVYQEIPTKIYSRPHILPGYPHPRDLVQKLAWIAHSVKGEYDLSPEADEFFDRWYTSWKTTLFEQSHLNSETFRTDTIILKTAMLLRAQEYTPGRTIELKHMKLATQLVIFTINRSKPILREAAVEGNTYGDYMVKIRKVLLKHQELTRRILMQKVSSAGIRSEDVTEIVTQLSQEGWLEILDPNGNQLLTASTSGKEVYRIVPEVANE